MNGFELMQGRPAFRAASMAELNIRILKGSHEKYNHAVSAPMKSLLKRALTVEVGERVSAHELTNMAQELVESNTPRARG